MLNSLFTRHQVVLAAIAAAMFFANLGGAHLWDVDEAIFSQAAKEMLQRGDYVTPYFNGEVFTHKPAMMYWLMIVAYQLFGTGEFAARMPSALFGVASVLVTYRLGRLMFSPTVGFWSGLVLATTLNFNVIARAATPDAHLTFFTSLALLAFVSGTAKARALSGEPNERNAPWAGQTRFEPSWTTYALAYAAMGCAVLTKGPVGVVLPTAVIGLFLLVMAAKPFHPSKLIGWRGALANGAGWLARVLSPGLFIRTVWSMRPLTAVAVVLAVAGPWYALVGLETNGQWLVGFFGVHNFGRFLNAMENHRGPIFYYVVAIAVGFFPWSVLAAPSFLDMKRELAHRSPWRPGYVLVGSWAAVWIGFFSLAGTKLPSYVVPAYPALALAMGMFVDRWLREPALVARVWTRLAWGTVVLVGIGMIAALPVVAHLYLADDYLLGALGLVPLVAGGIGFVLSERGEVRGAMRTLSALGIGLSIALFGFGAAYVDRFQDTPPLALLIANNAPPGAPPTVGSFGYFRPSFVFYADQIVQKLDSADEVRSFFAAHPHGTFVLTTDVKYEKMRGELPAGVAMLESRPRFLRPGRVVLLGRLAATSAVATRAAAESGPTR